jgi:hypothetical protein
MAAMAAALVLDAPAHSARRILKDAVDSLDAVFNTRRWVQLPCDSALKADSLMQPIFSHHGLIRSQIKRQFVKWSEGEPGINSSPGITDEEVRSTLSKHIGDPASVISNAVDMCTAGPVIDSRPWALPLLMVLEVDELELLKSRVEELSSLVVKYTPRKGRSSSHAVELEMAISNTRDAFIEKMKLSPTITQFIAVGANEVDLQAKTADLALTLIFYEFDNYLVTCFRHCFAPSAMLDLSIAPYKGAENPNMLVRQTLYYISGYLLSSVYEKDGSSSPLVIPLRILVAAHSISVEEAKALNLPMELVTLRTSGSLIYSSLEMFNLVLILEHSFSSLLSLANIIAFGSEIMSRVQSVIMESDDISWAFDSVMRVVDEHAKKRYVSIPDPRPILRRILDAYVKMRGKDLVKSMMSRLRLKQSASTALPHRSQLAAAATAASSNGKKAAKAKAAPVSSTAVSSASVNGVRADVSDVSLRDIFDDDFLDALEVDIEELSDDESDEAVIGAFIN